MTGRWSESGARVAVKPLAPRCVVTAGVTDGRVLIATLFIELLRMKDQLDEFMAHPRVRVQLVPARADVQDHLASSFFGKTPIFAKSLFSEISRKILQKGSQNGPQIVQKTSQKLKFRKNKKTLQNFI